MSHTLPHPIAPSLPTRNSVCAQAALVLRTTAQQWGIHSAPRPKAVTVASRTACHRVPLNSWCVAL